MPRSALRHDVDQVETGERGHHADHERQEYRRSQQGQRDPEKLLARAGTVDGSRLVEILRNVLQSRQQDDHVKPEDLPHVGKQDRGQRQLEGLQERQGLVDQVKAAQDEVEQPDLFVVQPPPDDADCHRHQRIGQEHDGSVDVASTYLGVDGERDRQRQHDPEGRAGEKNQRVP